uniref:Uncharacterized protein n=1 Tax=Geobacter sp. (strain M21) TaxID=443144 RepID=C6E2J1_GEOSM
MTNTDVILAGARRSAHGKPRALRALVSVAQLLLLACPLVLPGCGEIEWFPPYVRLGTTPDQFTFAAKTGTDKSVTVTSEPITVSGLTEESPIFVTGSNESAYSINGATATSTPGTVKNNDKVTVSHKSAAALGTATQTTLTIGTVSANFVSTTKNIEFDAPETVGIYYQARGIFSDTSGVVMTHTISIKDVPSSGNAQYAISDSDIAPADTEFRILPMSTFLNKRHIFVRKLKNNVAGTTTTLTIDGVDYPVTLTP